MISKSNFTVLAYAILPDHVHRVIGRHRYGIEQVVRLLKAQASSELARVGLHPLANWRQRDGSVPSPWASRCWNVFLFTDEEIVRAIRHVEANPIMEGKRPQRWRFGCRSNPPVRRGSANRG
jgi:REP element-mobilizing transposase RayT